MYTITFATRNGWADIATVDGCEAAYAAYRKACELGEMLGRDVALCDTETGEVVACLSDDEDDIPAESIACPTEDWGFQGNSCDPEFGPVLSNEFGEI